MSYTVSEEQIEQDELNMHECMLPLMKLIDHMEHNKITPEVAEVCTQCLCTYIVSGVVLAGNTYMCLHFMLIFLGKDIVCTCIFTYAYNAVAIAYLIKCNY